MVNECSPFVGSDKANVPVNPKILVNLRSVDGIDIKALKIEEYDGKSVPIDDWASRDPGLELEQDEAG